MAPEIKKPCRMTGLAVGVGRAYAGTMLTVLRLSGPF
jgi:hypothetical protein